MPPRYFTSRHGSSSSCTSAFDCGQPAWHIAAGINAGGYGEGDGGGDGVGGGGGGAGDGGGGGEGGWLVQTTPTSMVWALQAAVTTRPQPRKAQSAIELSRRPPEQYSPSIHTLPLPAAKGLDVV